jgi:ComF family protein
VSILKQLVFTPKCAVCAKLGVEICLTCISRIKPFRARELSGVTAAFCAGEYSGWLRESLISYKSGDSSYVVALAAALGKTLDVFLPAQRLTVIPIPSSREKIRERGYDSITGLCGELERERPQLTMDASNLHLRRTVLDQVGLNANQRHTNLVGAFGVHKQVNGTVLIVDDVVTTGATLISAAQALKFAGAQRLFVLALCGTPKIR